MNDFLNLFDEIDALMFNRPMKLSDMRPIKFVKINDGYLGIANTLGIDAEDISVEIDDNNYLCVHGETKEEELKSEYMQNFKVKINDSIINNLESVEYTTKNGITKIYLKIAKKENKFSIKKF